MRYLLNFIYVLLITLASPWLLFAALRHGKYRDGLSEKLLGLVPRMETDRQRIWFHAVSVGEVNLLSPILQRLESRLPGVDIVISTTTKTGFALAKRKYGSKAIFYCPLDFSWAVSNAFDRIRPDMLVLAELELWPNLLSAAGPRAVPVAIVNGRLSDKSSKGYLRLGSLMRNWMSNVSVVAAQSDTCAARFRQLGVTEHNVHTTGSIKFDGAESDRNNPGTKLFRKLANVQDHEKVILVGSTQAPEEAMAISVWQRLVAQHPNLRLIVVPRHPERYNEVRQLLDSAGVQWAARSELSENNVANAPVILVDTVGELGGWWGLADIGFVGGSMGARGGQNMIEPAAYGVATCFGPNTRNFRDVVQLLTAAGAAEVVCDEQQLETFVRTCLADAEFSHGLGSRAAELVAQHRGAADRTVELLTDLLPGTLKVDSRQFDNHPKALAATTATRKRA